MFDFINPRHWFQKRASALDDARVRMEQMAQYNALFHLDPDRLVDAITSFNAGDLGQLARIIRDFEERDDKMATCAMKMRASVGRCDYSILVKEGFENDERANRHAEILKRFWSTVNVTSRFNMNERGGMRLLKKQMMEAQSYGYAVHEIVWRPLANGEIAAEFIKLPLWHFENRTGALRFLPTETAVEGVPMAEGEWLVTTGDGVGIPASICAMAKRMCFQDWLLFSERSGMPIIVGTTGATFRSEQWNNIKGAIRNIYRDTRVLLDSGSKIEAIDTGHAANIPFPPLVEWSDRAIAALYRGADLSTISKGDGTGASLQGDEAGMIEQDAAANLGETLHEQVDRFVIRYVTGDDEPLASISVEPVKKPDVDTDIKIDNHLAALGVKLSKADALQRYGRTEAESDDDALQPPPNVPQNGLPGGFGGLANERTPATPLQTALQGVAKREEGSGRTTTPESGDAPQRAILAAFAKDTSKAAEAVKSLLAEEDPEKLKALSSKLLADLPSLIPEDPALAAVIAEAMAAEFGSPDAPAPSGALANEIANPCPKCHRNMPKDGTCSFCAKRAANHTAGKTAFDEVSKTHKDRVGAMERDAIGKIDFIWGNSTEGICHILDKHKASAQQIPGVLAYGDVYESKTENKFYVIKKRYVAVLRKRTGSNHYLITGFKAESPDYAAKIRKECSLVEAGE